MSLLKSEVSKISIEKNIRSDVLANYIAFRLSSEQNQNWWGTAESFQKPLPNGQRIVQNILRENLDFNALSEADLGLLKQIMDSEEIITNG